MSLKFVAYQKAKNISSYIYKMIDGYSHLIQVAEFINNFLQTAYWLYYNIR